VVNVRAPIGARVRPAAPVDARAPAPADAIDGVMPEIVLEPATPQEVGAGLAWAARQDLPLVVRGAGSKMAWGRPPDRLGAVLSTRRLNRVLDHQPGDLTVTVEAGTPLRELNASLAAHGQWLPLDPPWPDTATVGGLLATNDSGPLRHRFGTPRDLLIGIRLATTDGVLAAAGGKVVKNVAGYDLGKLVTGSFGALAAIVSATFKLAPRAPASATLALQCGPEVAASAIARAVADSPLEPVAFEIHAGRGAQGASTSCLLRFASFAAALDEQIHAARGRLAMLASSVDVLTGEAELAAWQRHAAAPWAGDAAVVRASWPPAALDAVLGALEAAGRLLPLDMIGRVGAGAGLVGLRGDPASQAKAVALLRQSTPVANVVVVRADVELKTAVDVWGSQPGLRLSRAVKQAMDPSGVLGAGRGPM
jgi:glycolate oxidase FAD binding subunit